MSVEKQIPQPAQNPDLNDPRWEDEVWKESPAEQMGFYPSADIQDARENLRRVLNAVEPQEVAFPALEDGTDQVDRNIRSTIESKNKEQESEDPILKGLTTKGKIAYIRGQLKAEREMKHSNRDLD